MTGMSIITDVFKVYTKYKNDQTILSIPMYDERFKEHLFDRIQQTCELYVAGTSSAVNFPKALTLLNI